VVGDSEAVDELHQWSQIGPPLAKVVSVDVGTIGVSVKITSELGRLGFFCGWMR
jgi:hypothetical protein